jgi:hypothetical protein
MKWAPIVTMGSMGLITISLNHARATTGLFADAIVGYALEIQDLCSRRPSACDPRRDIGASFCKRQFRLDYKLEQMPTPPVRVQVRPLSLV